MDDAAFHFAEEPETEGRAPEWGEPTPLFPEHVAPVPYPDQHLPHVARELVLACADYGQQPLALLAGSAWSSISLAAQPLVNVARDKNLIGPISLSMLTVARSGERKTAADKRMARAARHWEANRRVELAIPLSLARTAAEAWAARREGPGEQDQAAVGLRQSDGRAPRRRRPRRTLPSSIWSGRRRSSSPSCSWRT